MPCPLEKTPPPLATRLRDALVTVSVVLAIVHNVVALAERVIWP
jgi:hypothetical protein